MTRCEGAICHLQMSDFAKTKMYHNFRQKICYEAVLPEILGRLSQ